MPGILFERYQAKNANESVDNKFNNKNGASGIAER